jgi:WD40 repeat protein
MKEYKPISIKKYSKKSFKHPEARRFKRFKDDKYLDLKLDCNSVRICETNHNLATFFVFDNIYHFDLVNDRVVSKYPQATDLINVGNIRQDGKLIYTGLTNGKINIYEASKKNMLRSFNSHKLQVNSIDISQNLVNLVTSSNDLSFKIFDLAKLDPVISYDKAHGDYIKSCKYFDEQLILSGGCDKKIKLWDLRHDTKSPVQIFNNINICNEILVLKSKEKFLSTSENFINIFDIRNSKGISQANPVQGNINRLISNDIESRLFVVSSNENFVKVLDMDQLSMKSLYSIKFSKEISCFDISKDMNRYAVAYTSGEVYIRSVSLNEEEEDIYQDKEELDIQLLE